MATARRTEPLGCGLLLCGLCLLVTALFAGNDVLGRSSLSAPPRWRKPLEYGSMGSMWVI